MDEGTPGKVCTRCKTWKPLTEYHKGHAPDGRLWECKTCKNARARAYVAENREHQREIKRRYTERNPEVARNARMLHRYGVTRERYDAMLTAQGGRCAVCREPETRSHPDGRPYLLAVDHDHRCCPTGKRSCGRCVRALLCNRCNKAIGLFGDDAGLLSDAVRYLLRHNDSEGGLATRDQRCGDSRVRRLVDQPPCRSAHGASEANSAALGSVQGESAAS